MKPDLTAYTLAELCDAAGVTVRTVRYYISQGLLRSPTGAGTVARYDDGHLARLRLIRRLQRDHLPLAEIRRRLAALSDQEAIVLLEQPASDAGISALDYVRTALATRGVMPVPKVAPAVQPMAAPLPPPAPGPAADLQVPFARRAAEIAAPYAPEAEEAPDRSQWERIALDPDIELHVRRPLARPQSRAVDRLIQAARQILKEDLP